jgi:glycosyltransferase involved in cell wall biosynthesis
MGSGCPVVATGRGGSGEYLRDGDNCLLFPAGDAGALAAALRRLANSPELRERLRAGGLATAPRYTEAIFNAAVETELRARCAARQPVTTSAAGA